MPIEVRAITEDELDDCWTSTGAASARRPRPADRPDSWVRAELDRTRCAFDDGDDGRRAAARTRSS